MSMASMSLLPSSTIVASCYLFVLLAVYTFTLVIYRLTLHPLARYPGPLLSKITSLSVYLQAITRNRHIVSLSEHEKYGPIVRIAPNQLSFNTTTALRTIYQSSRQNNPLRKSDWYKTIDAPIGAYSTHTEISRTKHAFRRRVLDHAFSDSSLRSAEAFVIENVDSLCKLLGQNIGDKPWSKSQNVSDLSTWLAYDIMGDLVFGKKFDCLTSDEHRFVPKLVITSSAFLYFVALLPFQSLVRPLISSPILMNMFGGQLARDEHAYVSYANDRVTERLAMESSDSITTPADKSKAVRKDMMHYLLSARDPEKSKPFSRSDLDADSSLLIAAGADTTSTTLAAAFFYLTLSTSASILAKLQFQLRSQFPIVDDIRSPAIVQHTYLRAIIDETLRLAPPLPTILPRQIVPQQGLEIDGHDIPCGTIVGVPAYAIHHNESYFPDSWSFRPERWIPRTEKPGSLEQDGTRSLQSPEQVQAAREAFAPFSLGSRGCVGKSLAYLELCVALGRILHMYDIRRAAGSENVTVRKGVGVREDEYQLKDCFLAERDGPVIEFRRWTRGDDAQVLDA